MIRIRIIFVLKFVMNTKRIVKTTKLKFEYKT